MAAPRTAKQARGTLRASRDANFLEPMPDCSGNDVGNPPIKLNREEKRAYKLIVSLLHENTACRSDSLVIAMVAQDLVLSCKSLMDPDVKFSSNHRLLVYNQLGKLGLSPSDRRKIMDTGVAEVNPFATLIRK